MRLPIPLLAACALLLMASFASAQPDPRPREGRRDGPARSAGGGDPVARMMAFDEDKDGQLTKEEVTDARLHRLFARADADNDGKVSKAELTALFAKESTAAGDRGGPPRDGNPPRDGDAPRDGGPRDAGPGGPPGARGPGGRGGPGGPGRPDGPRGPQQPGQLLPAFVQDALRLTDEQKKQVEALQKDVDERLDKILTDEQKQQLKEMRQRAPGGPGDRGGPGGPGGPGRGPRDGEGPRGGPPDRR